jgi:hypothetical protein
MFAILLKGRKACPIPGIETGLAAGCPSLRIEYLLTTQIICTKLLRRTQTDGTMHAFASTNKTARKRREPQRIDIDEQPATHHVCLHSHVACVALPPPAMWRLAPIAIDHPGPVVTLALLTQA